MKTMNISVIIMAGGLGKRMNSNIPKVLHMIGKYPMLVHVIKTSLTLNVNNIYVIVGKNNSIQDVVCKYLNVDELSKITYVLQEEPLGTGHAIQCTYKYIQNSNDNILILSGDTPLISKESLHGLINSVTTNECGIMIKETTQNKGLGRIILHNTVFHKIVEEKDASEEEKQIRLVNCGIYIISATLIKQFIFTLQNNNNQKEYYLTDLIGIIKENNNTVKMYTIPKEKEYEVTGVNTPDELHRLNELINI